MACGWYAVSLLEVGSYMDYHSKVQGPPPTKSPKNLSPFENKFPSLFDNWLVLDDHGVKYNSRRHILNDNNGESKSFLLNYELSKQFLHVYAHVIDIDHCKGTNCALLDRSKAAFTNHAYLQAEVRSFST